MSKVYVETSQYLLEGLDQMIARGFYHDRTEAVNDAIQALLGNYKLANLYDKDSKKKKNASVTDDS